MESVQHDQQTSTEVDGEGEARAFHVPPSADPRQEEIGLASATRMVARFDLRAVRTARAEASAEAPPPAPPESVITKTVRMEVPESIRLLEAADAAVDALAPAPASASASASAPATPTATLIPAASADVEAIPVWVGTMRIRREDRYDRFARGPASAPRPAVTLREAWSALAAVAVLGAATSLAASLASFLFFP